MQTIVTTDDTAHNTLALLPTYPLSSTGSEPIRHTRDICWCFLGGCDAHVWSYACFAVGVAPLIPWRAYLLNLAALKRKVNDELMIYTFRLANTCSSIHFYENVYMSYGSFYPFRVTFCKEKLGISFRCFRTDSSTQLPNNALIISNLTWKHWGGSKFGGKKIN